jgi:hypothetical protein
MSLVSMFRGWFFMVMRTVSCQPHAIGWTQADEVNSALLNFLGKSAATQAGSAKQPPTARLDPVVEGAPSHTAPRTKCCSGFLASNPDDRKSRAAG